MAALNLHCPKCLDSATITVDLDDGDMLRCLSCEAQYSFDDVKAMLESWAPIIPWLCSHPARKAVE